MLLVLLALLPQISTALSLLQPATSPRLQLRRTGSVADATFRAAVHIAERGRSSSLSLAVLPLLRSTFAADWESLLARRGRSVQNLTCMRPQTSIDGAMLFDDDLLSLPLQPGGQMAVAR